MAVTNFSKLSDSKVIVWSRQVWRQAIEEESYLLPRFAGKGTNNMIQIISELTKTSGGEKAIITLVSELIEDGGVGDDERLGNEEELESFTQELIIDLINHGVKSKGKLAEQTNVVNFREMAKTRLSAWLGNRLDQLAMLTLAGVSYSYNLDGSARTDTAFSRLSFASKVTAPSTKRHKRWNGASQTLDDGDTTAVASSDYPTYKMMTLAKAYAKDHYVPPLKSAGKEYYIFLCKPGTVVRLKNDPDYKNAVSNGLERGQTNPFFSGGIPTIDGIIIHETRLGYSTNGATSGSKWGADGTINGTRNLLCGAQALGMADMGDPTWSEELTDHKTKPSINVDKFISFLKPVFYSTYDKSSEDFGVVAIDTALDQY